MDKIEAQIRNTADILTEKGIEKEIEHLETQIKSMKNIARIKRLLKLWKTILEERRKK